MSNYESLFSQIGQNLAKPMPLQYEQLTQLHDQNSFNLQNYQNNQQQYAIQMAKVNQQNKQVADFNNMIKNQQDLQAQIEKQNLNNAQHLHNFHGKSQQQAIQGQLDPYQEIPQTFNDPSHNIQFQINQNKYAEKMNLVNNQNKQVSDYNQLIKNKEDFLFALEKQSYNNNQHLSQFNQQSVVQRNNPKTNLNPLYEELLQFQQQLPPKQIKTKKEFDQPKQQSYQRSLENQNEQFAQYNDHRRFDSNIPIKEWTSGNLVPQDQELVEEQFENERERRIFALQQEVENQNKMIENLMQTVQKRKQSTPLQSSQSRQIQQKKTSPYEEQLLEEIKEMKKQIESLQMQQNTMPPIYPQPPQIPPQMQQIPFSMPYAQQPPWMMQPNPYGMPQIPYQIPPAINQIPPPYFQPEMGFAQNYLPQQPQIPSYFGDETKKKPYYERPSFQKPNRTQDRRRPTEGLFNQASQNQKRNASSATQKQPTPIQNNNPPQAVIKPDSQLKSRPSNPKLRKHFRLLIRVVQFSKLKEFLSWYVVRKRRQFFEKKNQITKLQPILTNWLIEISGQFIKKADLKQWKELICFVEVQNLNQSNFDKNALKAFQFVDFMMDALLMYWLFSFIFKGNDHEQTY